MLIFSDILVHLAYWRIIFFSQSTCNAPKKSVLKIDPPLYSISFCSFSRDYLWTSFEPNRSTEKDILQSVIIEMVWKNEVVEILLDFGEACNGLMKM